MVSQYFCNHFLKENMWVQKNISNITLAHLFCFVFISYKYYQFLMIYFGFVFSLIIQVFTGPFLLQNSGMDTLLWRYFATHPPSFYVKIESHSDSNLQLVPSAFQDWSRLHVMADNRKFRSQNYRTEQIKVVNYVIANSSNMITNRLWDGSLVFSQKALGAESTISITLGDLCKKQFLAKPALIVMESQPWLQDSAFWDRNECLPEMLIIKNGENIASSLLGKRWEKGQVIDGYSIFLHTDTAGTYRERLKQSGKFSVKVVNYRSTIAEILQTIRSRHPEEAGKKDEQLFGVLDITTKIVSLPDILDRISFSPPVMYLLLRGFSQVNMMFLGLQKSEYILSKYSLKEVTLHIITITKQPTIQIILAYSPSQIPRIFEQEVLKLKCDLHVDEQVYVKIRGNKISPDPRKDDFVKNAEHGHEKEEFSHEKEKPKERNNWGGPSPDHSAQEQPFTKAKQDKSNNKIIIFSAFIASVAIFFIFLAIRQTRILRQQAASLKLKSRIKKPQIVFQQISIVEAESQGTEMI